MAVTKNVVSTYTTSDGKKFKDETAANEHEASLALKGEIEGFCAFAGIPLTVTGKNDKERKNPNIKRIMGVIGKWNDYLNQKAA